MPVKKKKTRWTRNFYAFGPKSSGPAPIPPDYLNPGSIGDRRRIITLSSAGSGGGAIYGLIEGTAGSNFFMGGGAAASAYILFDFYDSYIINGARWTQGNSATQGVWKWQGSTDGSNFIDLGSTFTLGGSTAQTFSSLSGNSTSYRYYRLQGVSGNTDSGPNWLEFEFSIGSRTTSKNGCLYTNAGGSGNRAVPVISSSLGFNGPLASLLDGAYTTLIFFGDQPNTGKYIKFDFQTPRLIDEAAWWQNNIDNQGTWKWQGSTDDSNWIDIGNPFVLGTGINTTNNQWLQIQRELRVNTTSYRYYRLLGVSGNASSSPYIMEIEFRIAP